MMQAHEIEEVFHAARLKPPTERKAFLLGACGEDPDTVALLESLLASAEAAENFLEAPAAESMGRDARESQRGGQGC
jgi:hypothetical protein